jgi:hypothetical protein
MALTNDTDGLGVLRDDPMLAASRRGRILRALGGPGARRITPRDQRHAASRREWQQRYPAIRPVTLSACEQPPFLCEAFAEQSPFANFGEPMLGAKKKSFLRRFAGKASKVTRRARKTIVRAAKSKTFRKIGKWALIAGGAALAVAVGPALLAGVAGKAKIGVGKLGGMLAKIKNFRKRNNLPPISAATLGEETEAARAEAAQAGEVLTDDQALSRAEQAIQKKFTAGSTETAGEANRAAQELIPAAQAHTDAATLPPKEAAAAEAASEATTETLPGTEVKKAAFDPKILIVVVAAAAILSMLSQKRGIRTARA